MVLELAGASIDVLVTVLSALILWTIKEARSTRKKLGQDHQSLSTKVDRIEDSLASLKDDVSRLNDHREQDSTLLHTLAGELRTLKELATGVFRH